MKAFLERCSWRESRRLRCDGAAGDAMDASRVGFDARLAETSTFSKLSTAVADRDMTRNAWLLVATVGAVASTGKSMNSPRSSDGPDCTQGAY